MNKPESGFSTKVLLIDNYDGDTLKVKIERVFEVRIRGINAPELKEELGMDSRDFLNEFLKGKEITIFIPSGDNCKLMDFNSFNRVVADVWADDENVAKVLLDNKKAKVVNRKDSPDWIKEYWKSMKG